MDWVGDGLVVWVGWMGSLSGAILWAPLCGANNNIHKLEYQHIWVYLNWWKYSEAFSSSNYRSLSFWFIFMSSLWTTFGRYPRKAIKLGQIRFQLKCKVFTIWKHLLILSTQKCIILQQQRNNAVKVFFYFSSVAIDVE